MSELKAVAADAGQAGAERSALLGDSDFLESLRRQMLKFATLQLSDANLAEDAVQEALIGALRKARSFAGRAALKTWVFAILKNKIADILRQKQRSIDASSLLHEDEKTRIFRRCSTARATGRRKSVPRPGRIPRRRCAKANSGGYSKPAWSTCRANRHRCS